MNTDNLWIRRPLGKEGVQSLVVTIDIIEKVHRAVFLRDRGYVENKDRHLSTVRAPAGLSLPESIAAWTRATVHGCCPSG